MQEKGLEKKATITGHIGFVFEKDAALFLRLGLPSTLIRPGSGALRKRVFKLDEFETPAFRISAN